VILVVSNCEDDHARLVLERLERAGASARLLDLARFPREVRVALRLTPEGEFTAVLRSDAEHLPLTDCRVVWWRRPQQFRLDPDIRDAAHQTFALTECHAAFAGLWSSLDAFWVNDRTRDDIASYKPFQLRVAHEVGLAIPDTLVTNDPDEARAFVARLGARRTAYKGFSGTSEAWRETRVLRDDEVALLGEVELAPVIFQAYVPAGLDLRVTIVSGEAFAAAVHSQETPYKADYRMHMDDALVEPYALPETVVARLQALMSRLGLVYGAIDMRLTPDGRFVFLEVNPSGQWLFVEKRTGLPITEAVVRLLLERDAEDDQPRRRGARLEA
jgi:glutathione synthase/RimK-type ligase-like ATP-grasp enzyme